MVTIINPQLTRSQPPVGGQSTGSPYTCYMVENQDNFGERFEKLRDGQSYQDLSDAIFDRTKVRISPQAMNKWVKQGGGITESNARIVAEHFGVNPGWLMFGEGPAPEPRIRHILQDLPVENAQQSLDFIEYQIQKAGKFIAAEKLPSYTKMIESIRKDLEKRKGGK